MALHRIEPHKQSPSFCGPACLKMVLAFYGIKKSEKEIGKIAKTTFEHGTTDRNLLKAAKTFGLQGTWKYRASLKELRKNVEKHIPCIVEWFATNEAHYSLIVGYEKNIITMIDPEHGAKEQFTEEEFLRVWFYYRGTHPTHPWSFKLRPLLALTKKAK